MQYGVERVTVLVGGATRVEFDLCRACLSEALDGMHDAVKAARLRW